MECNINWSKSLKEKTKYKILFNFLVWKSNNLAILKNIICLKKEKVQDKAGIELMKIKSYLNNKFLGKMLNFICKLKY